MPSYTGTIRCSYCFEEGHNKRKCPRLTEEIKDTYEAQRRLAERYRNREYDHKLRTGEGRDEDREWNINYHMHRAEEARVEHTSSMDQSQPMPIHQLLM